MRDLDKVEYVHSVLQEAGNGHVDIEMVEQAIEYIEDIREPLIYKTSNKKIQETIENKHEIEKVGDSNTYRDQWGNEWDMTLCIEQQRQRMEKFND